LKRPAVIAGIASLAVAVAGCGNYDRAETETKIVDGLSPTVKEVTGSKIKSASCPAEVGLEDGTTFDCTAKLDDGTEIEVNGEVKGGSVRVNVSPETLLEATGT
jgi:hypothetical protein